VSTEKYRLWYTQIMDRAASREREPGVRYERHHRNPRSFGGDPSWYNSSENLVSLTYREHFLAHWLLTKFILDGRAHHQMVSALSRMTQGRPCSSWQYAISREASREAMRLAVVKLWESSEFRERRSASMTRQLKEQWKDPEYRERQANKMRRESKERWKDPDYRERGSIILKDLIKKAWENPEHRKKMSDVHKGQIPWIAGRKHTAESRAKMSAAQKGKPSKRKGKKHTLESRAKMSAAMKGREPWNKGMKMKQQLGEVTWKVHSSYS